MTSRERSLRSQVDRQTPHAMQYECACADGNGLGAVCEQRQPGRAPTPPAGVDLGVDVARGGVVPPANHASPLATAHQTGAAVAGESQLLTLIGGDQPPLGLGGPLNGEGNVSCSHALEHTPTAANVQSACG